MKINHSMSSLSRAQSSSSSSAPPLPLPPSPPLQEVSGTPLASPAFAPLISSTSSPPLLSSSPSPPLQSLTAPPTKNALPPATPLLAPPVSNSQRPVRPPEFTHAAPPPPSMLEYITPPSPPSDAYQTPPMGRYPPLETPPPPPIAFSYPPPMPGSVIPKAPGPPSMLINGSEQPSPIGLSLSPPSSSSSATPIGLIVGISIAVAGCFFIIALILLCFCYRRKKTRYFNDYESPPPKDNFYAALPQHLNQRIPAPGGAHVIQAPAKHNLLQRQVSSGGNSSSPHSESENPFSPQALGHGFGFSTGNFTYEELVAATGGFSEANLLGEGGFGYVHKGILPTGREIAVKQLKMGSQQGEREFQAEVETISRVHHRHLVSLVGYCITGVKRLLVYEFVPNRTLEFHLHGTREPVMNWQTRLKIAIGSAKGLAYLHEDCNPTIIHRDIKAANILLDSKFEAKVSDFGLAKFFSDANHCISHVSTRVVGTFGYLAPEYAQSGKASDKSDVFSYGVMLLELITGRPPIMEPESSMSDSLVSWARPFLRRALEDGDFVAMVDPRLQGNYNREELATMVACAAACVRHSSWRRPRMSQIIRALEGDVSLEDLDEGIRPGQSTVSSFFDYDSHTFKEMSKLKMTLASQENGRESSGDSTSEDDPHPSESSTDGTRPL